MPASIIRTWLRTWWRFSCVPPLIEDYLDQVLPHIDFDLAYGWERHLLQERTRSSRLISSRMVVMPALQAHQTRS